MKKGQRRLLGFDEKALALTTREAQGQLVHLNGLEVSPALILNITNPRGHSRPLDAVYPIVYRAAIHL